MSISGGVGPVVHNNFFLLIGIRVIFLQDNKTHMRGMLAKAELSKADYTCCSKHFASQSPGCHHTVQRYEKHQRSRNQTHKGPSRKTRAGVVIHSVPIIQRPRECGLPQLDNFPHQICMKNLQFKYTIHVPSIVFHATFEPRRSAETPSQGFLVPIRAHDWTSPKPRSRELLRERTIGQNEDFKYFSKHNWHSSNIFKNAKTKKNKYSNVKNDCVCGCMIPQICILYFAGSCDIYQFDLVLQVVRCYQHVTSP